MKYVEMQILLHKGDNNRQLIHLQFEQLNKFQLC